MSELDIIIRLVLSLILGGLIGVERVHARKRAGIRTLALVSMGAALFVIISEVVIGRYELGADPLRMASNIVTGIGFLGAGMIILKEDKLANLTTAAGVWVSAAIGTAVGFGMYLSSIVVTLLVIITFTWMWYLENRLRRYFDSKTNNESTQ